MWGRLFGGWAFASAALGLAVTGCGDDTSGLGSGGATSASSDASTGPGNGGSTSDGGGPSSGDGGAGGEPATGGSGGSGASDGGAPPVVCDGGPRLGKGPDCLACQTESCCINAAGCLADEACVAVEACTLENNSVSECVDENPDAIWYVSGVVVCRQNNCAEECGFEQAVCGNITPSPASCTEDVQAACCDETTACGESDACVALIYQCFDAEGCTDQSCLDDCMDRYPEARDDFDAMADCWDTVECID